MTRPYHVEATQREKAEVLRNDQRQTFQSRAIAEADDIRGRWTEIHKSNVVGATPTPQYPTLPTSSPFACDPTNVEPPLGYDINEVAIVGEVFEVAKSLDGTAATNIADGAASPCGEVVVSSSSDLAGAAVASDPPISTGDAEAPLVSGFPKVEPPANPKPKPRGHDG
jgi:hypothetical protein